VAAGGGARIAGLDAWRALLMLGGLFVHGTTYKGHRALFDAINLASDTFRMAPSSRFPACSAVSRCPARR
jgi:hypothetical protein